MSLESQKGQRRNCQKSSTFLVLVFLAFRPFRGGKPNKQRLKDLFTIEGRVINQGQVEWVLLKLAKIWHDFCKHHILSWSFEAFLFQETDPAPVVVASLLREAVLVKSPTMANQFELSHRDTLTNTRRRLEVLTKTN